MKFIKNLDSLDELIATRRAYRHDEIASRFEAMQDECDGLRNDLVDAGEIMLRAIEGCPDALDDMKTFLTRPHRNVASS